MHTANAFQFSVEAFNFQGSNGNTIYVHCESYVCLNTSRPQCNFGCTGSGGRRIKRDLNAEISSSFATPEMEKETFVTSTLEIKITGKKIFRLRYFLSLTLL